jgi:hypothetical protein
LQPDVETSADDADGNVDASTAIMAVRSRKRDRADEVLHFPVRMTRALFQSFLKGTGVSVQ